MLMQFCFCFPLRLVKKKMFQFACISLIKQYTWSLLFSFINHREYFTTLSWGNSSTPFVNMGNLVGWLGFLKLKFPSCFVYPMLINTDEWLLMFLWFTHLCPLGSRFSQPTSSVWQRSLSNPSSNGKSMLNFFIF